MPQPAALPGYRDTVRAEWVDYNGHLRDAYYLLIFSLAGDALLDGLGLDEVGREQTGHSMFTLECHVSYLQELKRAEPVEVRWQLLGADQKRLHLYFTLHRQGVEAPASVAEQMWLNVDMAGPGSTPFAPAVQRRIAALATAHRARARPPFAGRSIALPA